MTAGFQVIPVDLPQEIISCISHLVSLGYGKTVADVAQYLIRREVDDLHRSGTFAFDMRFQK